MGNDEMYHSRWFAFQTMQFLNDTLNKRKTKNTENTMTEDPVSIITLMQLLLILHFDF